MRKGSWLSPVAAAKLLNFTSKECRDSITSRNLLIMFNAAYLSAH